MYYGLFKLPLIPTLMTHKILKPEDWEEKYAPEGKIERELERQKRIALRKARVREEDKKKK